MDIERRKHLNETMKKLNKNFKEEVLTFSELTEENRLSTGIPQFDKLIGNGLSKGHVTVVYGAPSSGKSTLAYQTIANVQKQGLITCLIDMERSYDANRAKALGVNVEDLVLLQNVIYAEQAMDVIIQLSKEKAVDLIVLDSIHALSSKAEQETKKGAEKSIEDDTMALLARKLSQFLRVVGGHLFRAKISLLLIGQFRMALGGFIVKAELGAGQAVEFYSHEKVFVRRGQNVDAPKAKIISYFIAPDGKINKESKTSDIGFDCVLQLQKTKTAESAKEKTDIHLPFYFQSGFNVPEKIDDILEIEGTEEEKQKITAYLVEKGILSNIATPNLISSDSDMLDAIKDNEAEKVGFEIPSDPIKKKRGRKLKEKK